MAENEEELKSLLMKVKKESEKLLKAQHSENKDHSIQSHHFMANRWGNWKQWLTLLFGASKSFQMVIATMKLKYTYSLEGKL